MSKIDGPPDERALMGVTAGSLWLFAAAVFVVGTFLPGGTHEHLPWVLGLAGLTVAYGAASLVGLIPWESSSMRAHALTTAGCMPLVGLAYWATGGAASFLVPLLVLPLFYSAYFFTPRVALGLVGLLSVVEAAPLVYDPRSVSYGYPSMAFAIGVGNFALAGVVIVVKRRLLEAERRQRTLALQDPLTALGNRRAFDAALQDEVVRDGDRARGRRTRDDHATALLFVDIDDFKGVNDRFGHQSGDAVLCSVAASCLERLRARDTLCRIGGDEFAVVAPEAGADGAQRMAQDLADAVAEAASMPTAEPVTATVSWALLGVDGRNAAELMRAADRRLHDAKRRRGQHALA